MTQRWLTGEDRNILPAPFGVHFSVDVPANTVGSDGDYCFLYGNDTAGVLKKVDGTWQSLTGGASTFQGFNSHNSQKFTMTSDFSEVTISNFSFLETDGLQVEVDGLVQYEGLTDGYIRDSGLSKIAFMETIPASVDNPVTVFVGKYAGTGFTGFTNTNSELFSVATDFVDVTVTNFSVDNFAALCVEVEGVKQYEGDGFNRDTVNNKIVFTETLVASAENPVTVFVGKYN